MNAARFALTPELLREALRLPVGTVIRQVELLPYGEAIQIAVEHPDLPETNTSDLWSLPVVLPTYKSYHGQPIFTGWGA